MRENLEPKIENADNFSKEERDFAEWYSGSLAKQDDDFGFNEKEREQKEQRRKELLDEILEIDKGAKEKIGILEDLRGGVWNSKYLFPKGLRTFPDELISFADYKADSLCYLKKVIKPEEIDYFKRSIEENTLKIEEGIKRYYLGQENPELRKILETLTEEIVNMHNELEEEEKKQGVEWKDLSEEKQDKIIAEMQFKEKQIKEKAKDEIEKIEKDESEKNKLFAIVSSIRKASIRKDFHENSIDSPFKKISDGKEFVRKESEKQMMDYLPDIIELTPEDKVEEAVRKVYMAPGREGTKAISTAEEAKICSELTGIDYRTIADVIQRARPIWPSAELLVERAVENRPEYYSELEEKYGNFLERFRQYFGRLVEEDEEKIDMLMKGELRGHEAKEAFEILERVEIFKEKLCDREISGINLKDVYKEVRSFEGGNIFEIMSPERMDWLAEPMLVYYDPKEEFAYTDKEILPAEVKKRLEERIGYRSQSRRAFFIINEDRTVTEYKGFSPADLKGRRIVESSGAPEGILDASEGVREKAVLNNIGSVEADFKLVNAKSKNIKGKEMDYGVLKRKAKKDGEYLPFIRIASPDRIINKLAEHKKLSSAEFIGKSAEVFARELDKLHGNGIFDGAEYEDGKYQSWLHASNIEAHGHIVDVGATSSIERMVGEEFEPENPRHLEILTLYKAKDIDRFFGGNREAQHTKDTGFYDIKLKNSPEIAKEFIEHFIEIYLSRTSLHAREKIVDNILEEAGKTPKWSENMSQIIAEAHTKQYVKNIENKK